jgi:glycerate kinase
MGHGLHAPSALAGSMTVLAAPDKFKGTASAAAVAGAIIAGARDAGREGRCLPLADGGEGTLAVLGGANRTSVVTGPLGRPVTAAWRLDDGLAVIEMAEASGLVRAGGAAANDPLGATTRGTGELILEAMQAGARHIVVGVGGSATTDGGAGALDALGRRPFAERGVRVEVACDVETPFTDAAAVFGPQKGADAEMVARLTARLEALAASYLDEFGAEVAGRPFGGAAGGLAGGLYALGAELRSGFAVVAGELGLEAAVAASELVVTGEGRLDATSFAGKVVGGVAELAASHGVPLLVVAGEVDPAVSARVPSCSLTERFGEKRAHDQTLLAVREVVAEALRR